VRYTVDNGARSASVTSVQFESVPARTRSKQVVEILRDAILDGRLEPGSELSEVALATQFSVSRSPVREALRELTDAGLLVSIPYKGTYVSDLTVKQVDEVYTMRATLEELAVRRAFEHMTDENVRRLRGIIGEMERHAALGERKEVMDADVRFHREFCVIADHGLLLATWDRIIIHVLRLVNLATYKSDLGDVVGDHAEILRAIDDRDAEAAVAAIRRHIEGAAENAHEALGAEP
jgi:DNA-binding GntR family transcriptional regulator